MTATFVLSLDKELVWGSLDHISAEEWRRRSFHARVRKAQATLSRALRSGKIFHLWFHPSNLQSARAGLFMALRSILRSVAAERDAGHLEVLTMVQVAERASARGFLTPAAAVDGGTAGSAA